MIRLLIFLLLLVCLSLGITWFLEHDGKIIAEWLGYRVEISIFFATMALFITCVLLAWLTHSLFWVVNLPKRMRQKHQDQKHHKGLVALTECFAALASGDLKRTKQLVHKAQVCLGDSPLTDIVLAQTSQLEGNQEAANHYFNNMLEHKETELVALRGLLTQARNDGHLEKALKYATQAYHIQPNAEWIMPILIELYKRLGQWKEAIEVIQQAKKNKRISADKATRQIAIIYLIQSKNALEENNLEEALHLAKDAHKFLPNFSPVTIIYADLLAKHHDESKAAKILEAAWKVMPHLDIADHYLDLYQNETVEKRLKHAEKLFKMNPDHPAALVMFGKYALEAEQFNKARNYLKIALSKGESALICELMAELEKAEGSDADIVQQWLDRAQRADKSTEWKCGHCRRPSHSWEPFCPQCHSFDSIQWDHGKKQVVAVVG